MKTLFLILCGSVMGWGQTVEIESAYINKGIAEKKWDPPQMAARGKMWQQLRHTYPVFPYDTVTKKLHVENIITFPGVKKEIAFRRIKEWAAINYGKLTSVLEYEHEASGKIIIEGYSEVNYTGTTMTYRGKLKPSPESIDLYYSLVLTIVEGKAKIEYKNLKYRSFISGFSMGTYYVPSEYVNMSFGYMFPIVANDPDSWNGYIDLLKNSLAVLNTTAPSIEAYVRDSENDYRF